MAFFKPLLFLSFVICLLLFLLLVPATTMAFLLYLEEFSGEALNNIGQMPLICHRERCVLGANLNWMHDAVSTYQDMIGSCSVEEYTASWTVANVAEYLKYALRILALVQQLTAAINRHEFNPGTGSLNFLKT